MALTNSQYESILRGYEKTRDHNRQLLESRRNQVYAAIPDYRTLEDAVGSLSLTAARLLLDGDESARSRLHTSLEENRHLRQQLLTEHGFPVDYLDPIYTCSCCKDTGYIREEDGLSVKCHCFRRQELDLLYDQSNIRDMVAKANFSTLSYAYYQGEDLQRFQTAVTISQKFVQNFKEDYRNLFFYGTVGTGKSFLSGCIADCLLGAGHAVIYFSASSLFETLARFSFDRKEKDSLQDFCRDLYGCDLLIIDDLGTEITNSFVTSQLFACLNERALRKKPVIISTNLSLEELRDRYSDRIFSRVTSNFTLCKLTGPDIRICIRRSKS